MPLASGIRACRFELHSHAGRVGRKMPGIAIRLMTPGLCSETRFDSGAHGVCRMGLASWPLSWSPCPLPLWVSGQ